MNKKESFLTKIKENFSLKGLNPFRLFKVLGKIYGKIRSLLGSDPNKPSVIPVPPSVIPAPSPVIPAEAGIQKARFSYEPYGQIKSGMTKWILSSRGRRLRQSLSGKRTRLLRHSIPHSDEKGSTLFKGVVYRFNLIRLYLMELRYYLHIRFRKVHDKAFARKKTYYRYASKPYSRSINKASVYSFVISFTIFMALQFLSP
ncbi:hypothetical protein COX25_05940, partial [bacterium (Candidatus Howlettbacteria) CG23_combo_of_CG06-09_8_20_14_all_37_9]